ncbi:MAG: hypothetical protein AB7Q42_15615 [Acidimicrobiia bacterium]
MPAKPAEFCTRAVQNADHVAGHDPVATTAVDPGDLVTNPDDPTKPSEFCTRAVQNADNLARPTSLVEPRS